MRKESQDVLDAIERIVFEPPRPIVVALTGGWGEGKTYLWTKQVVPKHQKPSPGYVSVFGAESLAAIRERVVLATAPIEDKAVWRRMASGASEWLRRALNHFGAKYLVSDSITVELLQSFVFKLKPHWVICIDDVERLSASVGLEKFLGYVTELRDKWELKVVLIYNREPFDQSAGGIFHTYEEKVVDRSIPFALDFPYIVSLHFQDITIPGVDVEADVRKRLEILGLRNIRLLKKARSYYEEAAQVIGHDASPDFMQAALAVILLCVYTKFSNQRPAALTFELMDSHSEWTDRIRRTAGREPKEIEPEEAEAKALLERYQFMAADDADRILMRFIQTDILDVQALREVHSAFKQEGHKRQLVDSLRRVWDVQYHGRIGDNSQQLCDEVEAALEPCLPYVPLGECDSALSLLSQFGRSESAARLFEEFKRIRGHVFEALTRESAPHGSYSYGPLKDYIAAAVGSRTESRTLADVMASAFTENFIRSEDASRIVQFTAADLVDYFLANPQEHLTSKLRMLFRASEEPLRKLASETAKRIAANSPLDHMRMEGMGFLVERPKTYVETIHEEGETEDTDSDKRQ